MRTQNIIQPCAVCGVDIYDQLLHKLHAMAARCRHLAEHSLEPDAVPILKRMADEMDAAIPPLEDRVRACFDGQLDWPNARPAGVAPHRVH